ncbi:MAG TPA: hypothetical protein VK348_08230 [Planctomycetota bacterium]|nr:hypothetical protein [Planctomycetota bacterium]
MSALVVLSAVAAAPAQQLFFAMNDNTSYGNLAVGWPAAVIGFRFTAPGNDTVAAAQVFTGNQPPAAHTLELRAHDPVTGLPGTLLGQPGTWMTLHPRCWQGAVLPQPVALAAGQDYWLVWRVTGMFHQDSVSADGNPANVLVEVRVSDGSTWFAVSQLAAKFRLFRPYAAGATSAFGTARPGQYGDPQIGLSGWPAIGSTIDVWLDDAARRQTAVLLIGQPAAVVLPFGTSWTTANVLLLLQTVTQSSPLNGGLSYSFVVPNLPAAVGFPLTFQWGVLDPLAASGIAHTSAVTATLQ